MTKLDDNLVVRQVLNTDDFHFRRTAILPRGDQYSAGSGPTGCYGVPLYRQYLTDAEYAKYTSNPGAFERPAIRRMGQATGQRSTLTVNHGKYYIDDQVTLNTQMASGAAEWNIYFPNQTYYTYFVYAKSSMNLIFPLIRKIAVEEMWGSRTNPLGSSEVEAAYRLPKACRAIRMLWLKILTADRV